jgi:copper chaperone CopZ
VSANWGEQLVSRPLHDSPVIRFGSLPKEDAILATISLELPAMYADHHVVAVRRLLFDLSGVAEVYASSSFRVVEVDYDEDKLDADTIKATLDEAGYLGELPVPVELGTTTANEDREKTFFRHTAAYVQTGQTIGFAQKVPYAGRALWPCPGMGAVENTDKEMSHG